MERTPKKNLPIVKNCILILLISVLTGFALLLAVYLIPTDSIKNHIRESLPVLHEEGLYPDLYPYVHSQLDNWTDSLILNAAGHESGSSIWKQALLNERYIIKQTNAVSDPIQDISSAYASDEPDNCISTSYARYWHGYMVYVKPLLTVFNYSMFRMVNLTIQCILTAMVVFIMVRKKLSRFVAPYLIAWGILLPTVLGASIQFSGVFYIYTLGTLVLLLKNESWHSNGTHIYYFFILGIATSYIDFLTYPLATLGIPLVFYFLLKPEGDTRSDYAALIRFPIFWGAGYIGMWAAKWVLASIITDENVIIDAIHAVQLRSSSAVSGEAISLVDTIIRNLRCIMANPFTWIGIVFVLVMLIYRIRRKHFNPKRIWIYFIIAFLPFLWYAVTGNHSYVHYWFTCKALTVSVLAGMCASIPRH